MADCGEDIDRISDLPSNVIDVILQHLPIQDLVKTSILSMKWRYMWTSVLALKFTRNYFQTCKRLQLDLEISSIITELLLVHNGPLHEFTLDFPSNCPIKMQCLSKWILCLSRKGVKRLTLLYPKTNSHQTPSHVFSCQELTYLKLQNSKLSTVPPNFHGFKSLVTLRLFYITFESGALESLMSGCSLLEVLVIVLCSGFEHINVSSPVLKCLLIVGYEVIKSICLKQTQNLIDLTLWADEGGDNIEGSWASDLLKDLPKIKRLSLERGYIENLSAGIINPQVQLRSVNTLTYLALYGVNFNEVGELLFTISLLESSPNLKELVIQGDSKDVEPLKEFDCNDCCFSQLQIVNIMVKTAYKHALHLIRFVLAKSSSLKILTFRVGLGLNQSDAHAPTLLSSISHDLSRMERASPRAEVKFLYDGIIE